MKREVRGRLVRKIFVAVAALCVSAFAQWDTNGYKIYYNSGNVGIGTNDPAWPLQIYNPSDYAVLSVASNSSNGGDLQLVSNSETWEMYVQGTALRFYNSTSADVMTITQGGFVGIGTASPGQRLEVNGTVKCEGLDVYGVGGARIGDINGDYINIVPAIYGDPNKINSTSDLCLEADEILYLNSDTSIIITSPKVGIGTTSPSDELEVNGNTKCDTVKCLAVKINNWVLEEVPDYVFEKNYKLASLKEVEKHIAAKKHLPNVPSAAEIKKNGIDLAAMNMTLLKKVEELTLYAIEQNKRIAALEKKISGQK